MRKIIYCLIILHGTIANAQQKPQYTQYILNNYVLNPALSGIENYTDLKISARDQWVGLNGAPRTMYLSVHTPLGKRDYKPTATSFSVPGQNPRGSSYWESYEASAPHHGVGFSILNYKTGLYNQTSVNLSYAYHLGLSAKTNLSGGFATGINKLSYDQSKATPTDPNDPAIGQIGGSSEMFKVRPDLSAGLWLYSSDYFVGLSAQQIIPQKYSLTGNTDGSALVPHLFATAGYRFLLSEDVNAMPSVMFKYVPNTPTNPQFDLNLKLQYQDLLWVGGSYRLDNGYAAMLGLNVVSKFNIGYSYDFTKTIINTASRGTHEIIIGFLLGNKYDDSCPRNMW